MFWPQLQDILYAEVKSRQFDFCMDICVLVYACFVPVVLHQFLSHLAVRMAVNIEAVGFCSFAECSVLFV